MSTTRSIGSAVPATPARVSSAATATGNRSVQQLRSFMLTLVSAALAFGVLAGLVSLQAVSSTYDEYHAIVDEGSVSVDAALRARSLALNHMSASATYLETTGANQNTARQDATNSWNSYSEQARVSWRNITDAEHGESGVFTAADAASSIYIQQIGAMYSYAEAGNAASAGDSFLAARETMNTRLVPALTGLEAVKVEMMEATYAGAEGRIGAWRNAVLLTTILAAVVLLAMILAVRRMHYRWSWPVGIGLVLVVLLGVGLQAHLASAASDARILVRDSYDNVAGVQDMAALLSQERALDSLIVFNPEGIAGHLADFNQYNTLVEQRLCGPRDCTATTFLSSSDTIAPAVSQAGLDEQSKLGLARAPLVASVHFTNQAARYEDLRVAYREWLAAHDQLVSAAQSGQRDVAASLSSGASAAAFTNLTTRADDATAVARNEFNNIWNRVYTLTPIWQLLALGLPLAGALGAYGVWRRRNELLA